MFSGNQSYAFCKFHDYLLAILKGSHHEDFFDLYIKGFVYYDFCDSNSPLLNLIYWNYPTKNSLFWIYTFRQMNTSALNDYKDMD